MESKLEQLEDLCRRVKTVFAAEEIEPRLFDDLALALFEFQFTHNLPYQRYCRSLDKAPESILHWQEVPPVVTPAFKEADWTILKPAERTAVFFSSGTTARERSRHFHSLKSLAVYEASLLRWFKPFVLPDLADARFLLLSPAPPEGPNSSLVHMFETVSRAFGCGDYCASAGPDGAWHLDFERIAAAIGRAPLVVCGTAFSFVHLCDWARDSKARLHFPEGSRVFETGGYKGRSRTVTKPELHALISQTLGIPEERIISEYGMSELSSQAYDRVCGQTEPRLFRFPPWTRVQIINPETGKEAREGEPGLIRVFDLANIASVMAVQTEDLGICRGDAFELLGRAAAAETRGCSLMPAS